MNPTMTLRRLLMLAAAVLAATSVLAPVAGAAVRHVSPAGEDSGRCAASACQSLDYVQSRAAAGDIIELAGGEYGAQEIDSRGVELRAVAGERVVVDELRVSTSGVTIRDVTASKVDVVGAGAISNITLVNVRATKLYMRDVHGLTVRGGAYGDTVDEPTVLIDPNPASTGVTFDGVDFHDATLSPGSSAHMECIWAGGVQNFTVRNSIFRNCAYFDIFFTKLNGPDPKDVLLENNVFEAPKQPSGADAPYAINIANWLSKVENFTIRNNTFGGDVTIQPSDVSNVVMTGNLGVQGSCKAGVEYVRNVWATLRCGPTDKVARGWLGEVVDRSAHDWRLRSGAAAIDSADPSLSPPTDREGKQRVGPPDAGAHEFGDPAPSSGGGPPVGGNPPASSFRLKLRLRAKICRQARARCPASARLRVQSPQPVRLKVRLRRYARRGLATVRTLRGAIKSRRTAFRLRARGLPAGRYRIVITATDKQRRVLAKRATRLRVF